MYEIKIGEPEYEPLLNRDGVIADVKRIFVPQVNLLADLTNYGTSLIPRAYSSSKKELKDVVLIGVLLRQVVAMLDGVEILSANGAIYAAELQARAMFEASVYMEWILKGDTERKASHYYVHNLRRLRRWGLRMQSGTPEAKSLPSPLGDLESFRDQKAIQEAKKTVDEINVILSQPEYIDIDKAFDKCARDPVKADKAWHYPLGKQTLAALIADLGKSAEYTVFYAAGSEVTHSSNYARHIHFGTGTVSIDAIRQLPGFESLFRFSVANALRSYQMILAEYRSGELQRFGQKYVEKWRKAFFEVPKVKYDVKKTGPASGTL